MFGTQYEGKHYPAGGVSDVLVLAGRYALAHLNSVVAQNRVDREYDCLNGYRPAGMR